MDKDDKEITEVLWGRIGFLENQCAYYFKKWLEAVHKQDDSAVSISWLEMYEDELREDRKETEADMIEEMIKEWREEHEIG